MDECSLRGRGLPAIVLALIMLMQTSGMLEAQPKPETIPEAVARGAFGRTRTAPSGKSPSITDIVRDADVVVRGIVGQSRSYLSEDNTDVYTDHELIAPQFLYLRKSLTQAKPGSPGIAITQLGGTITIGNVAFTQTELGLPLLVPGTDAVFILKWHDGKYHIARSFFGAFMIQNGTVEPVTPKHDFAREYRGAPADNVLADIMSRIAPPNR